MVLQNLNNLDEHTASKYPGIQNYAACQSKAFVQGLLGMTVGGGTGAIATFAAERSFPRFPSRYNVFYITGAAVLAGYLVTARASRICQKTLVQSQLDKTRSDHDLVSASSSPSKVAEIVSESSPSTDQLMVESVNVDWKRTKYGDVMG